MKKLNFIYAIYAMVALALVAGCKKEDVNHDTKETVSTEKGTCKGMLRFSSAKDFAEVQRKVLAMGEDERREWERQQGFKSFATKCHELLEEFEATGIKTDNDIYGFVEKHPEYFYICKENGELALRCHLSFSPYFYLANEDGLLFVNNHYVKAFEEGIAYSGTGSLDILKGMDVFDERHESESVSCVRLNRFVCVLEQNASKDDDIVPLGNTSAYKGLRSTRSNNRNTIELKVTEVFYPPTNMLPSQYITDIFIYNYPEHKTLGMWFPCKRTMNFDVDVKWTTRVYNNQVQKTNNFKCVNEKKYSVNKSIETVAGRLSGYSFDLFKGTAYTHDTPWMHNFDSRRPNFGL